MTTDIVEDRTSRRHSHETPLDAEAAHCPYCGQTISRKEFDEIRARIEAEERDRIAKVEQAMVDRFAREKGQAEATMKAQVEKARREATKAADAKVKASVANQERVIAARLAAQREANEKKLAEAVSAERAKMFAEKLKLEEQLEDMQRRLQRKTAHELGEPAEVDLFEALGTAFPDDRITRVGKGQRGADVIMEVVHNGGVVGSIIVESKNHRRWSNKFVQKLRADQLAKGADFAILSSSTFPKGARELHIQDGVIVASPARVLVLAHLLRRQIVENSLLKLTVEGRAEKADRLYQFILSPVAVDLLDRIVAVTAEMADLDRTESSTHQKVWAKRAELIRAVQHIHKQFSEAVSKIVGGK